MISFDNIHACQLIISCRLCLLYTNILTFSVLMFADSSHCSRSTKLMEAEIALYLRTLCRHLQMEAQVSLLADRF